MINFGPATITWESVNQLVNGDFELWSSGNNANNWYATNNITIQQNNNSYSGNSSALLTTQNNADNQYIYQPFNNTSKPMSYWRNKTVTVRAYAKGPANNFYVMILYTGNSTGGVISNALAGNNNWTFLTACNNFGADASEARVTCRFNGTDNTYVFLDKVSVVEGPYNLGKTIGGGSIQLYYHNSVGMYTKNLESLIYGGEGVLHMFQWNNTFSFNNNSPMLYDYGKLTIACNNITYTIDCAKLFLAPSYSFGTFTQHPIDIHFSFKKSPDTGNYITIS